MLSRTRKVPASLSFTRASAKIIRKYYRRCLEMLREMFVYFSMYCRTSLHPWGNLDSSRYSKTWVKKLCQSVLVWEFYLVLCWYVDGTKTLMCPWRISLRAGCHENGLGNLSNQESLVRTVGSDEVNYSRCQKISLLWCLWLTVRRWWFWVGHRDGLYQVSKVWSWRVEVQVWLRCTVD